jgi:hypothetical protein
MIVNGNANANANAKRGRKKRKGAKAQGCKGRKRRRKKETQRCKGARTQRKPGSQNLEQLFSTLPSYLHPTCNLDCNLDCNPFPSPYFFSSLRPCAFAPLRFLLLFFSSLRSRLDTKKNQPTRGLGESADGCFLKDASERRVD